MWRDLLSLLLLLYIGSSYSFSFRTYCPEGFKQYGDRSCFKLFNDSFSFQQGSTYCHEQHNGKLLTISNSAQYNRTSTYIKLYGNSGSYWTGLIYHSNAGGELVLTDVDNNSVDASMYGLDSAKPVVGDCVYVEYSEVGLMFVPENCSDAHRVICVTEWPAPTKVNISSSPRSYGIEGQQVVLMCEFPPDIGVQFTVLWRFNGDSMGEGNMTMTISSFQPFNEGCYSCVVSTEYWSISSVDLCVKLAAAPVITRPPMNATVYNGQQGFFDCLPDSNYNPEPIVKWYRNGSLLDTDAQPQKYFVSPNTKTLLLSQVDADDAGDYHCVLSNSVGSVSSSKSHLNVLSVMSGSGDDGVSVADHEFRLTPQPLTVFVGENATFDCVGKETTARYQWIAYDKDSNVIDVTNISIPEDHLFSSQTYTHVQVNEIFEVRCVIVEIDQLIYSERTALKVVERTWIVNMSDDATVQYGTDYVLTCQFTGTSPLSIHWMFNGDAVDKGEYEIHDGISILTVKKFQPSMVGVYQCLVTNQYGVDIGSVTLYGRDGQPDCVASLFAMSKQLVSVNWFTINPNSEPDLNQLEVTWTNVNNDSAIPRSILLSDHEFNITDLNPSYHLYVIVAAITPSIRGADISLPLIYPFGNAPDRVPEKITVVRINNNEALNISWIAITPNHSRGEGDMFGYEIEYRNKKVDNAILMEYVSNNWAFIEGLYSKGAYEVRVRCVVMVQSIPLPTKFENGPWSEWIESEGAHVTAAPLKGSNHGNSLQVAIPVSIISVILIVLVAGCVIYRLRQWVISKRAHHSSSITYSSMKNENAEDEEEQY